MYELKIIGKIFTSKFVGIRPSSHKNRIYRAAVSQRLRNTGVEGERGLLLESSWNVIAHDDARVRGSEMKTGERSG